MKWIRGFLSSFLMTCIAAYALYLIPVPYYIYKPGTAERLKPMVHVEQPDPEEKGAFMLTTVSLGHSSVIGYLLAHLDPNAEIRKKADVLKGSTEEEYTKRQEYVMLDSQSSAIQAAYHKANIPYKVEPVGVTVMQTFEGMPAQGVLHPGDSILKVGGQPVKSLEEVRAAVSGKKAGDPVEVVVKRGDAEKTFTIPLADLSAKTVSNTGESAPKIGFGISIAELLSIRPEQPGKAVTIRAGDIGGPSAGLMFSLEIYNQLTPGDLTKGYIVAGTGTIDPAGNVCSIGGIRHKIVAADREGAEIFFAPIDRKAGECGLTADVPNASDAIDQAKKIKSKMKVVPVATMDDALKYLAELPPQS